MSYFVNDETGEVFFGMSRDADLWIRRNMPGAAPRSAPKLLHVPGGPDEIAPGVLQYWEEGG